VTESIESESNHQQLGSPANCRGKPLVSGTMDYEAEIKKLEADVERYWSTGRDKDAERKEEKVVLLQREWDKEKKVVKPHPA